MHRNQRFWIALSVLGLLLLTGAGFVRAQEAPKLRVVYFYSTSCEHCMVVLEEVLKPLQNEYGDRLEIKMVEISSSENYQMLLHTEDMFGVPSGELDLPVVVVGSHLLSGEQEVRERLPCVLNTCENAAGTDWPEIPGLEKIPIEGDGDSGNGLDPDWMNDGDSCTPEDPDDCEVSSPIWMAYFYDVGCQDCDRVKYDIRYIQDEYPQVMVEEYNVQDHAALAEWLGARAGVAEERRMATPTVFVGDDVLIGDEINVDTLSALAEEYEDGAEKVWSDFDEQEAKQSIIERFKSFGLFTVIFAGLVDGLNPCAFATLAFFVSYLTLSGRKGREVLFVGIAFTLGVFLAYLAVGMGFYQVLDMLGGWLTRIGRWVYGLTGLFCAVLAVMSFLDFLKARDGDVGDMSLNLPHSLRMRINAIIRRGRKSNTFVIGSFFTGLIVSFLELACTGQVYLPTIIFVMSQPDLQVQAFFYLVLYNLLFILPLVVVFILVYFGTGSKDLTEFLKRRAATVKLGMTVLFAALAVWLFTSVVIA